MATKKKTARKTPVKKSPAAARKSAAPSYPARYERFITGKESAKYEGMYWQDLPNYLIELRYPVSFLKPGTDAFTERLGYLDTKGVLPLCTLKGEDQFLCLHTDSAKLPVSMWEHEDGKLYRIADSFDEFLSRLHKKGKKTPLDLYLKEFESAVKLRERGHAKKALPIFKKLESSVPSAETRAVQRAEYLHERAHCREDLGDPKGAMKDFEEALSLGDDRAGFCGGRLALLTLKTPARAITLFEKAYPYGYDGEAWPFVGLSLLADGKTAAALKQFSAMCEACHVDNLALLDEARELVTDVASVLDFKPELTARAIAALTPKEIVVSPAEEKKLRAWWKGLPAFGKRLQGGLLAAVGLPEGVKPAASDLGRMMLVDQLYLDEFGPIKSVEPFTVFKNLRTLCVTGPVQSLVSLKKLKKLEEVSINDEDIALPKGLSRKGPFKPSYED